MKDTPLQQFIGGMILGLMVTGLVFFAFIQYVRVHP